jgi:hypothetical protein
MKHQVFEIKCLHLHVLSIFDKHVHYLPLLVLRIRIRRIRMFLGLLDPDQDLDPDPSITNQN